MNQYSVWRYILIVLLIIAGAIYALPNWYGDDYAIQLSKRTSLAMAATTSIDPNTFMQEIKSSLGSAKVPFISVAQDKKNTYLIRFKESDDQRKAQDVLQLRYGKQYAVALNLAPRTPEWLQILGAKPMRLGLDLRGGIHFLLYVNIPSMLQDRFKQDTHSIGQDLRDALIRYQGIAVKKIGDNAQIELRFRDQADMTKAQNVLSAKFSDYTFTPGDKKNNILKMQMSPQALMNLEKYAVTQNITTLRNKVNELGVAEPLIQQQGKNHISVDLPGIQDTARAQAMIGTVATVSMHLVDTDHDAAQAAATGIVPVGDSLYYYGPNKIPFLLKNEIVLSGRSITNAAATIDSETGRPAVSVSTSGSDVSRFYKITSQNVGNTMAVVYVETKSKKQLVDGKIKQVTYQVPKMINYARIMSALSNFQITGLTNQEAKDLALQLRSGAYTAPVSYAETRIIGPSLGKTNIRHGVLSCEVGSLFVILFMALYYRLFGLIANVALILNVFFVVAVMSILGATMTLPGIAGIVLTVGMAVDANVLINERIREELRLGMTPQAAIHAGYERAFATIVDANVTTLLVALVLYSLGTGSVQGFAITLIIGLLTSMLTAIFFTRAIVNLIYGRRQVKHLSIGIKVK